MRYIDAAIEILRRNERPMTAAEITESAITSGLIKTTGKTPSQTMGAALYVHAKVPGSSVTRIAEAGRIRARRGSVRWTLRQDEAGQG